MNKKVSVIIPTLDSGEFIEKCLASVRGNKSKYGYELIVVDGGSQDKTMEIANKYADRVLIKKNSPPGEARNLGVKNAGGEVICFTDSDCIVPANWIDELVDGLCRLNGRDSRIAGVGSGNIPLTENASFVELAISRVMRSPLVSFGARNVSLYKDEREVQHNPPVNSAYFKWVLEKVNGFREEHGYPEDLELDAKINEAGYKLYYLPHPLVYHKHKSSPEKFAKQMRDFGRKRVRINREHKSVARLYHYGPLCLCLMLYSPLFFIPLAMALINSCYVSLRERYLHLFVPLVKLTISFYQNYGAGELEALFKDSKKDEGLSA